MTPLDAALRYAARGWPIFPCEGKRPLTPNGFKDATTDAVKIEEWWRRHPHANVSAATGRISGLVVLDVDVKSPGANGWDALEELGALPLADTPIASTPSGGTHFFFDPRNREIPLSVGKIGRQLDVRGERACCTLPTPGTAYRWDPHKNPKTTPLAPAPAWLTPPSPAPLALPPIKRPPPGMLTVYGANAINSAVSRIFTAPEGQQSTTMNRESYGLGQLVGAGVIPAPLAIASLLHGATAMPAYDRRRPWRRSEIERSVRASFEAGLRRPRHAS